MLIRIATALALLSAAAQAQSITLQPTATPVSAKPGTSVSVTGSGFPAGAILPAQTQVVLEPGNPALGSPRTIPATAVTTVIGTTRRVTFQIPTDLTVQSPTGYRVTINGQTSTGIVFQSASAAALTIEPPGGLTQLQPNASPQGQSVSVQITGVNTGFVQGSTQANFGPGISVGGASPGSFGLVSVISPTTVTATLQIDPTATTGPRDVSVRIASNTFTLRSAFTVQASAPATPTVITLNSPATPASVNPGGTVSLVGTGFPAGAITPQSVQIRFEPELANAGPALTAPASAVASNTSDNHRTVTFTVPSSINLPSPVGYLLSLSGQTTGGVSFASSNKAQLTISPADTQPRLITVSPQTGIQGQTLEIRITGLNTSFSGATTRVNLGSGVTTESVSVSTSTVLTARCSIQRDAVPGPRSITVTTGSQVLTANGSFTVQPATGVPTILSVTPTRGNVGTTLQITVTGLDTNFQQGTTQVSFGPGISVANMKVIGPTQLTADLAVATSAPGGDRTISVNTGSSSALRSGVFRVIGPELNISTPANGGSTNVNTTRVSGNVGDPAAVVTVNGVAAPVVGYQFAATIPLVEGFNTITVAARSSGGASSSAQINVNLDTTPPKITVLSPVSNQDTTEERITVAGLVNDIVLGTVNEQDAQVTVAGIPAQIKNRTFVATGVPLVMGLNQLAIVARDKVGELTDRASICP